tara:strand:- start:1747 stop:2004 length:258 start_codon:yes stop_codon:yes gene_type:complete
MEFHIDSNIKFENQKYQMEVDINATNYEEVIFIAIHELKLKLIQKFGIEKDNLSFIVNSFKLNTKDNKVNIKAKCNKFDDWELIN